MFQNGSVMQYLWLPFVRFTDFYRSFVLDVFRQVCRICFATEAGQRARAVLPDGTKVWLNASTQLVYKPSFWKRERLVDLNGEAYFEVSHNKHKPFVVNSKDVRTCVLGTKFNVRARSSEAKVVTTLLKGLVQVQLPGQSKKKGSY